MQGASGVEPPAPQEQGAMMAQSQTVTFNGRRRVRKFFGKIPEVAEMPNLIEVQKASYDQFLMVEEPKGGRPDEGLQAVFRSVFPISDFSGASMLEFVKYEFELPKFDVDECRQRDLTYAAPLKVTLRLIVFDMDEDTGAKSVKDIKEQDVYMGDMPLMTSNGTFIINGTERVIVSQMHRSPGVFFDHDKGKSHSSASCCLPHQSSRTAAPLGADHQHVVHAVLSRGHLWQRRRPRCGTVWQEDGQQGRADDDDEGVPTAGRQDGVADGRQAPVRPRSRGTTTTAARSSSTCTTRASGSSGTRRADRLVP